MMIETSLSAQCRNAEGVLQVPALARVLRVDSRKLLSWLTCSQEREQGAEKVSAEKMQGEKTIKNSQTQTSCLETYARLLDILERGCAGDLDKIAGWLREPRAEWLFLRPIDMFERGLVDCVLQCVESFLAEKNDVFCG